MNIAFSITTLILTLVCNFLTVHAFVGVVLASNVRDRSGIRQWALAAGESNIPDSLMQKVWQHAKKPLISVGSKGATKKHGNSLRQLLDDHTVVKVKVNTKSFGTLEKACESLLDLAIESGASRGIEMIQMRESDRIIMFGLPGTLENVENGKFPPPTPLSEGDNEG